MRIPVAKKVDTVLLPKASPRKSSDDKILFSFAAIERNEYFNLDGTCQNWASDLFEVLQYVSNIPMSDIYARKYTGSNSRFRIHPHLHVNNPCAYPTNVRIEDMWQIRIGKSKGGVHGIFVDNVFYIIWFDPQHNLYPDENHGGLKKITPPSTCCKERDSELCDLQKRIDELEETVEIYKEQFDNL